MRDDDLEVRRRALFDRLRRQPVQVIGQQWWRDELYDQEREVSIVGKLPNDLVADTRASEWNQDTTASHARPPGRRHTRADIRFRERRDEHDGGGQ